MSTAQDLIIDQFAPMVESGTRLTTWYAQGHSDGLGDRLLMFDNTSAPSWEILRFNPTLARDPRFETALRHRVERLSTFHHQAFPLVRSIKELGHEGGLAVVSTYVSGVRLSDALKKPRSAEFALQLIRQLMPALNALHEHAPVIAHGALTLDRVVLTADGRLMIREHMVGSAIEGLELSATGLWSDFGILVPPTGAVIPRLDGRSDVTQLALVALSLVAGRRIGPDEYPQVVPELLERLVRLESLRHWLQRALQLDDKAFGSVREAIDALSEPQHPPPRDDDGFEASLRLALPAASRPEAAPPGAPRAVERQHPLAPTGIVPMLSVPTSPHSGGPLGSSCGYCHCSRRSRIHWSNAAWRSRSWRSNDGGCPERGRIIAAGRHRHKRPAHHWFRRFRRKSSSRYLEFAFYQPLRLPTPITRHLKREAPPAKPT